MGEATSWVDSLAHTADHAVERWHNHRLVFILCGVLLSLLTIRYLRYTKSRQTDALSPTVQEKAAWLVEKEVIVSEKNIFTADEKSLRSSSTASRRPRGAATKVVSGRRPVPVKRPSAEANKSLIRPIVFYTSLTGTTKTVADLVVTRLAQWQATTANVMPPEVLDLSYIDLDDYFISGPKSSAKNVASFYLVIIPSYNIDSIIDNFLDHLNETHHDFRIDTAPLSSLAGYSVFGLGDREGWPTEEEGFCTQAAQVDKWLAKLTGRKRAYPMGLGDVKSNVKEAAGEWVAGVCTTLDDLIVHGSLGEGVPGSGAPVESDDELAEEEEDFPDLGRKKRQKLDPSIDVEDTGGSKSSQLSPLAVDFTTYSSTAKPVATPKAMVPKESPTYNALTKQGYTIVGTHSGVKICRWTKSALRGRGSCYKNSFYGIASHLCMETTPSLSCSNKCVFCWRHGTNPVSTTWRWSVDPPEFIFAGAKEGHYKKIKMMRGVPGVRADRFEEAMRIRHCALSLVGEPIFYPHINEFLDLLHGEQISSFLVCNAQHPAQLQALCRVTQLYVSIDASNKDSLRKIDRPLHRDFWERFQACLDILREKRFIQRTVFRLTLVKGFNIEDEVDGYADLVAKGLPCFVEVKGVTYCGTSSAAGAGLTMQNVPFYEEVVDFVKALDAALAKRGLEYGLAAEHAHSCCILLASKRFLKEGKWHTLIDYDKFFELLKKEQDGEIDAFGPEDYCAETAEWAVFGKGGFDPRDERVDRKGRPKKTEDAVDTLQASEEAGPVVEG